MIIILFRHIPSTYLRTISLFFVLFAPPVELVVFNSSLGRKIFLQLLSLWYLDELEDLGNGEDLLVGRSFNSSKYLCFLVQSRLRGTTQCDILRITKFSASSRGHAHLSYSKFQVFIPIDLRFCQPFVQNCILYFFKFVGLHTRNFLTF